MRRISAIGDHGGDTARKFMIPRRYSLWAVVGAVAAVLLAVQAAVSAAAIKGKMVSGAPPWLSLYGVAVRPDGAAYAVGSKGLLMVSEDNGKTWDLRIMQERPGNDLFQDLDLYSIHFTPDGKSGWVVGERGIIMHSDDGGESWHSQQSGVSANLFNVSAVDAQHAYACGEDGLLLGTNDGGQHWTSFKYKDPITFFDISYTDPNSGWAVGEFEAVLHTTDGGKTWNLAHGGNTGDFTIGPYFSILISSPTQIRATGLNGEMAVSNDGGKTWTAEKLPEAVATYAAVQANGKVWLGGEGGRLVGGGAGGKWTIQRPTFNDITDLAFSGNAGYAVGLNGTILRTDDAGKQWQVVK
jgi:photosystem II stability/assembly factor-like uncharacterized protein